MPEEIVVGYPFLIPVPGLILGLSMLEAIVLLLALLGALAIGISLGLLGSGGSILTVPVLHYLVGQPEKTLFLLITDLYEGGDQADLVQQLGALRESRANVLCVSALNGASLFISNQARSFSGRPKACSSNICASKRGRSSVCAQASACCIDIG